MTPSDTSWISQILGTDWSQTTREGAPSSITAVGFALAVYAVGVEHNLITRSEAIRRTLVTLRFLWNAAQSDERDSTGYRGFFYHFLDMDTGRRAVEI